MNRAPHLFGWILMVCVFPSFSQDLQWVNGMGSDYFLGDAVKAMDIDEEGNVYLTGRFSGMMDFDPGPDTANIAAVNVWDPFVAKYDAEGNYSWAIGLGSSKGAEGNSIAVDASGNVYVAGQFLSSCNFDPDSNDGYIATSSSGEDMFLAKYDPDGHYLWAINLGGTSYDFAYDIALDESSNIYLTGFFRGSGDFDPSNEVANLTTNGINDIVLAKYSTDGEYLWAKNMGGSAADEANSIALDHDGNIYICGHYFNTADFDPGLEEANLTANGIWDSYIAKYDNDGQFLWVRGIGGTENDDALSLAVDSENNVVCTGFFHKTVDLNPGPETDSVTAIGSTDIYLVKFDKSGNYLWGNTFGGGSTDLAKALAIDPADNIYLTGFYRWSVDFDPDPVGINLLEAQIGKELFMAKYDPSGNHLWAKSVEGQGDDDEGNAIVAGSLGNFYVGGEFFKTADFNLFSGEHEQTSEGAGDIFFAQYSPCASTMVQESICSGETFTFPDGVTSDTAVTHSSILTTPEGCDSLITTHLMIDTVNTNVLVSDNTLTAESSEGSFQWVDCDHQFSWLENETSQVFQATESGNYAVLITEGSCTDTSLCLSIIGVGTSTNELTSTISVYPNPTNGIIHIDWGQNAATKEAMLMDLQGRIIRHIPFYDSNTLDLTGITNGIYLLQIRSGVRSITFRISKTQ